MRIRRLSEHTVEVSDPKTFTGEATVVRLHYIADKPGVKGYRVTFQPRARTDWHSHCENQLLIILDGVCRLQTARDPVTEVTAGDVVSIEAGERHWHGASDTGPMTHLALNVATPPSNGTLAFPYVHYELEMKTIWREKVADDEYNALLQRPSGLP